MTVGAEMEPAQIYRKPLNINFVSSIDSPEFAHLNSTLSRTSVIGLDAEWKPIRTHQSTFPTVSLLQIACLLNADESNQDAVADEVVFLLDLSAIHLPSIYELLRQMFESPDILKLGFRFKQDLAYLSSTFLTQGCCSGLYRVEPFLDISSIYYHLNPKPLGRRLSKETKSLAVICKEMLGVSLSKELQCSDWSSRPLTEEQMTYAAIDAYCLIEIFNVFLLKVLGEGNLFHNVTEFDLSKSDVQILKEPSGCNEDVQAITEEVTLRELFINNIAGNLFHNVTEFDLSKSDVQILKEPSGCNEDVQAITEEVTLRELFINTIPMNDSLLQIVRNYCDKIVLKESDTKPKISKNKNKRQSCAELISKERQINDVDDWQGPPPWDRSLGGDGCPKFLCDVMVEGLAKHLRCVGIDAAVPNSRKPSSRDLIEQAYKEKRVLLTRDSKLKRYGYVINNQIYKVKELLKNQQLVEVVKAFQLEINVNQLMSRCTKCNGMFIQKPLSTEEAIEAAKGFQVIPNCLFNKNLEFWQCMDCNQLYWEGTQYHNAVQKFIDVCNLNAA